MAESPLRVDLCGMTDYIPAEGWCVNSTIGLLAKAYYEARSDDRVVIDAGSYGVEAFSLADIGTSNNMLLKSMLLNGYDFPFGLNVDVNCEFGAIGLSSSSSVASLYNAFHSLVMGKPYDLVGLAKLTQAIEPHWYGRQDQLSVAGGGLNLWHMSPGRVEDEVAVSFGDIERYPITMPSGYQDKLAEDCFLLYHSGIEEGASLVLTAVRENYGADPSLREAFSGLNASAKEIHRILSRPDGKTEWLHQLGETFNQIRDNHERLHPSVTNQRMQDLFFAAQQSGALGGRYSGAGGRGTLTFVCLPGQTAKVARALDEVDTPYVGIRSTYTKGKRIHFGGFTDNHARAWFEV